MRQKVKVAITYCAECGYETDALAIAEALMRGVGHHLSAIEIIPWQDGSFEVTVGGELVHSMYRDGGFPEPEAIVEAVRTKVAVE